MISKKEAAAMIFGNLNDSFNESRINEANVDGYIINSLISYLTCTSRSLEDLIKHADAAGILRVGLQG